MRPGNIKTCQRAVTYNGLSVPVASVRLSGHSTIIVALFLASYVVMQQTYSWVTPGKRPDIGHSFCIFKGLGSKAIMEVAVLNLQSLYDQMRSQIEGLNDNIEPGEYFIVLFCSIPVCPT